MPIVEINNITKSYGDFLAVGGISISIEKGRIFGLLGPNGAGKTSTIRMLNAITYPDSGTIRLFGEPLSTRLQDRIGYMPEERGMYRKLTVKGQLEYFGALRSVESVRLRKSIDYWLERFELGDWAKKKTSDLSKGMQQKVQFIATVLHDPDLLILDEPVSGLDPINAELINDIISELRANGKTILLSSHRMEQVEQICDDIAMINKGKIVLSGTLRNVKSQSGKRMIRLVHDGTRDVTNDMLRFPLRIAEKHTNEIVFEPSANFDPQILLRELVTTTNIVSWQAIEPSLKEIFLQAVANS